MRLVIDASVAVKWLVVEDRHELARDVLRSGFELLAPDLLLPEVANALRNKLRAGLIGEAQAAAAIDLLPGLFDRLIGPQPTLAKAFDLACRLNHPVADCVYIACALKYDATLLTDDAAFRKKARNLGDAIRLIALTDWTLVPSPPPFPP